MKVTEEYYIRKDFSASLAWILFDKETTDRVSHLRRLMKYWTGKTFIAVPKSLRNTYCDKSNILAELLYVKNVSWQIPCE
jgi:hypothetical protein